MSMASNDGRSPPAATDTHKDLPTCGVCWMSFTDGDRRPIDLGCGHCFCEACIKRAAGSFRNCPECRKRSREPHVSITLLRLVRQLQGQPGITPTATTQGPRPAAADVHDHIHNSRSQQAQQAFNSRPPAAAGLPTGRANWITNTLPTSLRQDIQNVRDTISRYMWPIMAVLYVLSPLDLVPDIIPVLGWIDDAIVVVYLLLWVCVWQLKRPTTD